MKRLLFPLVLLVALPALWPSPVFAAAPSSASNADIGGGGGGPPGKGGDDWSRYLE